MTFYPVLDFIGAPLLVAIFLLLLWVEKRYELRKRVQAHLERLLINGAIAAAAVIVARLAVIPVVVWVAQWAERTNFGLLNVLPLPAPVGAALGFVLLDYAVYLWHRLTHHVPFLWRFHRVHHTDLDLDVSTAFRFHFGELLAGIPYRGGVVALLGASPALALVYEIVMEAATEFHHSNWRLPARVEEALRWIVVTPRMHGIHHSIVEEETNSNWSVIFSWWDRLHHTLRRDVPQEEIIIGVPAYRDPRELTLFSLLVMPFRHQRPTWLLPGGLHPQRPLPQQRITT